MLNQVSILDLFNYSKSSFLFIDSGTITKQISFLRQIILFLPAINNSIECFSVSCLTLSFSHWLVYDVYYMYKLKFKQLVHLLY